MKVSTQNAPHYSWGDNCDGWHLLARPHLSVIQEKMPPGTAEIFHYHERSEQLFYILQGQATFLLDEKTVVLNPQESIHILPGIPHRILNNSTHDLHFLVISHPKSHGDRITIS